MTTFAETLVARVVGIQKKRVAEARKSGALEKGADWMLENACVVYTPDGLKKICRALGVDAGAWIWPGPDEAEPQPSDAADEEMEPTAAEGQPASCSGIENQPTATIVAASVEQIQATAELVEIVVTRTAPNPRIVFGRFEERIVTVGVRDNKNFKPGMKLQAHHAGGDYFRMFGNCPRWPGRW